MSTETSINSLPDEVLEFIFSVLPPYKDLEACALVCKRWTGIIRNVRRHTQLNFNKGLRDFRLCWKTHETMDVAPIIAGRYSHSAIIHENSMYVFGGGSSTATTFNDLWRFDLSTRQWIRPISMGTYPSPKACASMVSYKNLFILFGGWRHPSAFPPYQPWRLFDELHAYIIAENKWFSLSTTDGPPPVTGHSATIHGDSMVVFGGYAQNGDTASSSNDVWSLDLTNFTWSKKQTSEVKPAPRYGQFQIALDERHFLVLGGCGGPNNMFNDAWVLDMTQQPYVWNAIEIRNKKWAATHMWCNPVCKVDSKLVILGPAASASSDFQLIRHQILPSNNNRNVLQREQPPVQPTIQQNFQPNARIAQNRRPSDERDRGAGSNRANAIADMQNVANVAEDNAINRLQRNLQLRSRQYDVEDHHLPKRFGESPSAMQDRISMAAFNMSQGNRPNSSTSPRERRLQSLRRMEEKIQALKQSQQSFDQLHAAPSKRIKRNCIGIFVCDISSALLEHRPYLEWVEQKNSGHIDNAPERLILSSLVHGNGELIMFGGLRKESLSKSPDTAMQVSNAMHFLHVPREII